MDIKKFTSKFSEWRKGGRLLFCDSLGGVTNTKVYKLFFLDIVMKLNESGKSYKVFDGNMSKQMQALIAEGRIPMNYNQLMQRQLDTRNSSEKVKRNWLNSYFYLGDAIFYYPDGKGSWDKFKIVLDSKDLRNVTPKALQKGGLIFSEDYYKKVDGPEFKHDEVIAYLNHRQSRTGANNNPVLLELARGDKSLLKESNDYLFSEGNLDKGRGVYVLNSIEKPEMRAWYAPNVINDAYAYIDVNFKDNGVRLVGLTPETSNALNKRLEERANRK